MITITVDAASFEAFDDSLAAAAADWKQRAGLADEWALNPQWGDEGHTTILLTVPTWSARPVVASE